MLGPRPGFAGNGGSAVALGTKRWLLTVSLAIAALGCAAPGALAQGNSGLDEYAPSAGLPRADGNRPGGGDGGAGGPPLGAGIRGALPNSVEGALLERIATSKALGAPDSFKNRRDTGDRGDDALTVGRSVPSTVASTVSGSNGHGMLLLLVALAAITGAGLALALRQRRRAYWR